MELNLIYIYLYFIFLYKIKFSILYYMFCLIKYYASFVLTFSLLIE